ncbi:MAG: hypothetical protein LBP56_10355 [Odoribacteraceae bacterium]|nr:hypothetical protein [Odoribacteraceae bacterium]
MGTRNDAVSLLIGLPHGQSPRNPAGAIVPSLPQRGIIYRKQGSPVSPIARGAFISALFMNPRGGLGTSREAVSLLIGLPHGQSPRNPAGAIVPSLPQRGIISIETRITRISNSPWGFHFDAFYESPQGIGNKK